MRRIEDNYATNEGIAHESAVSKNNVMSIADTDMSLCAADVSLGL